MIFNGQPQLKKPVRFDGQPAFSMLNGVEFRNVNLLAANSEGRFDPDIQPVTLQPEPPATFGFFFGIEVFGNSETFGYRNGTFLRATSESALKDLTENSDRENEVFLIQDHAAGVYVRNPNRILPEVDLSAMSPWNSLANDGGQRRAGTLITSKHIALAGHYNIPNGTTIRFVDQAGNTHDRIVVDSERFSVDIRVGTLDADLPDMIKPFKVLPENWRNFTGDQFFDFNVIFATDQEEKLLTKRLSPLLFASGNIHVVNHTLSPFDDFTETVIGGDSGNPIFFIINNQPVYVSQWHTATSGTPIYPHYALISAYVGPDHSLDFIDLSTFKEFEQ